MSRSFTSRFPVRSYELDMLGHVNNAVFLNWLEHARLELFEALGYPLQALIERRWRNAVVHVSIDYRREVLSGETVVVTSELESIGRTSLTLRHRLDKQADRKAPVATARVVVVWQDIQGRPVQVPDEVRRALVAGDAASEAPLPRPAPPGRPDREDAR